MNNEKFGKFIAELRKQKNMTQKELAEKLNLTSKAISKWETGQGYPEITIIPLLAEIIGVSVGELLDGEFNTAKCNENEVALNIIKQTVIQIDEKQSKTKSIAHIIMSVIFLFASFVCILCNYLINNVISWSLYPIGALVVLWFVITPILIMKKHKAIGLFIGLTITSIPYLFLIQHLSINKGWVIPIALPIHLLSLIALGICLFIFNYTHMNIFYCSSIAVFLYGVVINISVGKIVENYLNKYIDNGIPLFITVSGCIFISVVLIAFGLIYEKRKRIKISEVHNV